MSKFTGICGNTYRLLDGAEIPLIGLGTYGLRSQNDVNTAVDAALANGYRLFDTANFYNNEKEIGIALEKLLPKYGLLRENIFIETKANIRSSNVRQNAQSMIENSLKALRTTYLDLLLIHYPKDWGVSDNNTSNKQHRMEMYKVLEEYKDAGKIKSIGVSNFEGRHIDELWDAVKFKPTVNQCEFHPHLTRPDVVEYCRKKNIFFQAHTSLAKNSKLLYADPTVTEIAKRYDVSVPHVLLAFAYCQNVGVIPKSQNPERIANNLKLLEVKLTSEEIENLNALNKNRQYSHCDGWNVT